MATKNNPGKYDCYENAAPDEPMFVLLGRDAAAAMVVLAWISARADVDNPAPRSEKDNAQLREAYQCARDMWRYAINRGKREEMRRIARSLAMEEIVSQFEDDEIASAMVAALGRGMEP